MRTLIAALTLMASLNCPADPLHAVGNDGTFRHEDSGWLFAAEVGDCQRIASPYTIDGNADAGAHYSCKDGMASPVIVDVFARESFAADATFEGARQAAHKSAGAEARALEQSFELNDSRLDVKITRVTFSAGDQRPVVLYFAEKKPWTVKILASGVKDAATIDAFVRSLPWPTLGSDTSMLHGA